MLSTANRVSSDFVCHRQARRIPFGLNVQRAAEQYRCPFGFSGLPGKGTIKNAQSRSAYSFAGGNTIVCTTDCINACILALRHHKHYSANSLPHVNIAK